MGLSAYAECNLYISATKKESYVQYAVQEKYNFMLVYRKKSCWKGWRGGSMWLMIRWTRGLWFNEARQRHLKRKSHLFQAHWRQSAPTVDVSMLTSAFLAAWLMLLRESNYTRRERSNLFLVHAASLRRNKGCSTQGDSERTEKWHSNLGEQRISI